MKKTRIFEDIHTIAAVVYDESGRPVNVIDGLEAIPYGEDYAGPDDFIRDAAAGFPGKTYDGRDVIADARAAERGELIAELSPIICHIWPDKMNENGRALLGY